MQIPLIGGFLAESVSDFIQAIVMILALVTMIIVGVVNAGGFGATFGPIMLFSLFWKRTTRVGAIAGMLSCGISVFVWKLVLNQFLSASVPLFGIYELLPAFIISSIAIIIGSLASKEPEKEIIDEFEKANSLGVA